MDIGFIGLGNMGFPMARRLVEAGHEVVAFDTRPAVVDRLVAAGAHAASSVKEVADRAETVMASLPSLQASRAVAADVADGSCAQRFVDFSTVGQQTAIEIDELLAANGIVAIDSPVSGGVSGAQKGTLAIMVSAPRDDFDLLTPVYETIGRAFYLGDKPGSAQTMKLVNNMMAATGLIATCEAVAMGVKAGLDASVMIDVLNAGSGATNASRDKFPRSILPRTFDFGFATGLMVKDVRLYVHEAKALGVSMEVAEAVARLWEVVIDELGPESDFTAAMKPIEQAAGIVVGGPASD
jgi:3-hydroxyisobutyrate dehydrogenase-like beta-hydroxyacid dehydrogenase